MSCSIRRSGSRTPGICVTTESSLALIAKDGAKSVAMPPTIIAFPHEEGPTIRWSRSALSARSGAGVAVSREFLDSRTTRNGRRA
jgi:hypothetical protein